MSLPNQIQEISPVEGQQHVDNQTVGLVDLGNSSHGKRRKLRSEVWFNFEKYKDEVGKDWAKCNLCQKVFDGSSKKGTTHLNNHFNSCRRKRNGGGDKPAEAGNIMNPIAIKEKSGMVEQLNRLDMTRKIIREGVVTSPYSVADIMDVYKDEKEKLRKHFEKLSCRFCLTINVAKTDFGNYICLMVHFIDDDWKIKEKYISVKYTENYQNLVKCSKNELLEWGIDNNISSVVTAYVSDVVDDDDDDDDEDDDVVKYFTSSNERENWFSGQGSLLFDSKLIVINSMLYQNDYYRSILIKESLGILDRMRSVLNYIMETPFKSENFRIAVDKARSMGKEVNVEVFPTMLQLEKMLYFNNVETMGLLKIGLGLKEAFFELENIDPEFKSINLTKEEWDRARLFYQESCDFTPIKHLTYYRTANMHFPTLCSLYTKSLVSAKCGFVDDYGFVQFMDKCWGEYKLVLAVAAVLDPRFKMDIVKRWYEKIYDIECEAQLTKFKGYFTSVYNEYGKGTNNFKSCTSTSEGSNSSILYEMLDPWGKRYKSTHRLDHVRSPNSELHIYLEDVKFPPIEDFDVLEWWRDNTRYFPTLARMARDFLSIQICSSPHCEDVWDQVDDAVHDAVLEGASDTIKSSFICTKLWTRGI